MKAHGERGGRGFEWVRACLKVAVDQADAFESALSWYMGFCIEALSRINAFTSSH